VRWRREELLEKEERIWDSTRPVRLLARGREKRKVEVEVKGEQARARE